VNARAFGEAFVTLVVIMDPIGSAPIFVALTAKRTPSERRWAAVQTAVAAGLLVVGFALFGRVVLDYLRVSVDSLTLAGGLLLLLVALEMLRGTDMTPGDGSNVVLVPLATPLLAGPGAIATVMVLARRYEDSGGRLSVVLGVVAAVLVIGASLMIAGAVSRFLRPSVIGFITRVLGLLLSAIAVQLVVDAVRGIVHAGL